jgi:signal transduction histidine kinase
MKRFFVRAYLAVLAAYVASTVLLIAALNGFAAYSPAETMQRIYGGPAALLAGRLADESPAARGRVLADLQARFGYPIGLAPRESDEVPEDVREAVRSGERFVWDYSPILGSRVFAPVDANVLVRLGPLPGSESASGSRPLVGVASLVLVFALAIALIGRPLVRELGALETAARAVEAGELGARAPESLVVLRAFARTFNAMVARTGATIESQRELFHAVSHEIRTPLSRLQFRLEAIRREADPRAREEHIADAEADVDAIDELVEELLTHARLGVAARTLNLESFDVRAALEAAIRGAAADRGALRVRLECDGVALQADRRLFVRSAQNLVTNARKHARAEVVVHAEARGDTVVVTVDDDGDGIAPEDRERVFEPFFRKDGERRGVGLGLAIVRRIADAHGGRALVLRAPSGGCRAETTWPIRASDSRGTTAP